MSAANDCPKAVLTAGETQLGFFVKRIEQIPEIRVTAYELEHLVTGAKILHLHCDDRENLYAIAFRTPPQDSTGLPHILEHAVLAGSKNYPVKDAFNELLRGTLQTFINAFTYPDKTIYPVASQVKIDFFNLARVYSDLVFRPRLLRETFLQEGHHLEWATNAEGQENLTVSGIVYNEMKGAYSSPDNLMYKAIQENLFPDTIYRFDSGGNPAAIPNLTYEQFKEFHQAYYSPSNARIFIYGDIPTGEHLLFLQEMLKDYGRISLDSSIPTQKGWSCPRAAQDVFPIGREDDPRGKASVNMAWLLTENTDEETVILLQVVSGVLVGSAAGALRKALIDSGLGQDLSPVTGFERDYKQVVFAVGLRGTEAQKREAIESLILDTLAKVVREGVDQELIEGTLHQIEFRGREIVRQNYPYGIVLMNRVFHTWIYDGDPLHSLNFPRLIEMIRRKWQENPSLFEELIQKWLIDNPHRILSVMEPSPTCMETWEEDFRKKMAGLKDSLTKNEHERIHQEVRELKAFQTEPDPPAALATLPRLKITDIGRQTEFIPGEHISIANTTALSHDLFTNGISYLDLAFDVSAIPDDLQQYLPLLGKFITQMGAAGMGYETMSKRIALKTGGIRCSLNAGLIMNQGRSWQEMIFRLKTLDKNIPDAIHILLDLLCAGDLTDQRRMQDLLVEKKNRFHASIVPSGHLFARRLAASSLSVSAWRDEQWHGKTQLVCLKQMADELGENREVFLEKLLLLKNEVFRKDRLTINLTAEERGLRAMFDNLAPVVAGLPSGNLRDNIEPARLEPVDRGVVIPAQVSYVARALPAPSYGHSDTAALMVASRYLSNGYLYKQIRVLGGAYGGMSSYDPMVGIFSFLSYRDPHILRTLKVYDDAITALSQPNISQEDLDKAVIGTIGVMDRPMDPSNKGYTAMIRHLSGLTDAYRQTLRDEILAMTIKKLRETATCFLDKSRASRSIAVFSSEEQLQNVNVALEEKLLMEAIE
ncbi:MAG: insulinase family protein [Syntrophales bacterium]